MESHLHRFATELASNAFFVGEMIGCPHRINVEMAIKEGRPIGERYLPGRMIMGLPEEKKEMVKKLKAHHFNNRMEFF